MPASGRSGSACFVIDNIAYIISGRTNINSAINEVWAYDIQNDSWQRKNDLPFGSRWRSSSTASNGSGYLIFGMDENNHFSKELLHYDPSTDAWSVISNFSGNGRTYSTLNSISGKLILTGGMDSLATYYNDVWTYQPSSQTWQLSTPIPSSGRKGGMCFNNNSTLYYTTGIDQTNTRLTETWKCLNPAAIDEHVSKNPFVLFPNPSSNGLYQLKWNDGNDQIAQIAIENCLGEMIFQQDHFTPTIDMGNCERGIYFLRVLTKNENIFTLKIVRQ